ncbi:glycosyltransferase family 4 protein [Nitrosomonas sp.]|uniref:glycosyltransferase family 4 protein n=1 Tax=Nitrosomonas sp. TaxID=42353 RepID=UPI0025D7DE61|nr:glycosyltransferase family 4 protein [Nitrosomonas sp.]
METSGLHIGLIGPLPPPSGGMANQTRQLAELLQQEGVAVTLIQTNAPYYPKWIEKLKGLRAIFRLIPYLVRIWVSAKNVQLFHVMANSGWSWHLYVTPVIWIAWLRRKPVVITYHGGEAEKFFNQSFFWIRPSLRRVTAILVPSGFLQGVFGKFGFEAAIVPNVINLGRFSMRDKGRAAKNDPHIIITRNLEPIYDIASALHAFSQIRSSIPTARLTIAGSGPERSALEHLVTSLGLNKNVRFTGRLDNEMLPTLYQEADVMINPSLVDNMPISILEALASGVPVVSTDVGGIPFLVTHEKNALLVPPARPEILAEAVLRVFDNPPLANHLIEEGIKLVQEYAWPNVREQLLMVYRQVLK